MQCLYSIAIFNKLHTQVGTSLWKNTETFKIMGSKVKSLSDDHFVTSIAHEPMNGLEPKIASQIHIVLGRRNNYFQGHWFKGQRWLCL